MKRATICILSILFVFSSMIFLTSYTTTDGLEIVYITDYGTKYHTEYCGSLWDSSYDIFLEDAVDQGYEPCEKCDPPILEEENINVNSTSNNNQSEYTDDETTIVFVPGQYILGNHYHRYYCSEECRTDELTSKSLKEALEQDYIPCPYCNPPRFQKTTNEDKSVNTDNIILIIFISVIAIVIILVAVLVSKYHSKNKNKSTNQHLQNSINSNTWKCPKCNAINSNESKSCNFCNANINTFEINNTKNNTKIEKTMEIHTKKSIIKSIGLSLLSIIIFLVLLVISNSLFYFLIYFLFKIPLLNKILDLWYFNILFNYLIEIIIFTSLFKFVKMIINKISEEYTDICTMSLAILLTIVYSLSTIVNIISIFIGGFSLRMTVLGVVFLIYSIVQIVETKKDMH